VVVAVIVSGRLGVRAPAPPPEQQTPAPPAEQQMNIADFIDNTANYKGEYITLNLTVMEPIFADKGHSLRDFAGRDVRFYTRAPNGGRLNIVLSLPAGLPVPNVGYLDRVEVTFVCKDGSLRSGNEARSIVRP